jgi:hypothetical protein
MTEKLSRPPTIGVDFDGVIHAYSKGWHDGTIYDVPVEHAFVALSRLLLNYNLFIMTSRSDLASIANWFQRHHAPFLVVAVRPEERFWNGLNHPNGERNKEVIGLTNRKLPADSYIDDRAIRFYNWPQAFADIERYDTMQ